MTNKPDISGIIVRGIYTSIAMALFYAYQQLPKEMFRKLLNTIGEDVERLKNHE